MRFMVVLKVLGVLSAIISAFMIWPLGWAIIDGSSDVLPFVKSVTIGLLTSLAFLFLSRKSKIQDIEAREAFVIVSLSWIVASAIGGLPYLFNGTVKTFTDAFFEAMSGFTTTGASVLTDIQSNPRGILFWRDLTHWLGGMGIIVLSLAVLPFLGVGGMQLYKAEVPGPVPEKLTPRIQQTALLLWGVYVFLSALEVALLLGGGMNLFESLTHTFGTMATGGFSPLNGSIGQYNNPYFDWVITIFMFLAGANFALHYMMLRGDLKAWWKDEEFRFYTIVIFLGIATATSFLYFSETYGSLLESLRYAAFQVVSIVTTTGYVTADYEKWPFYVQYMLLFLMFVGGCAGSTGGGIKNLRIMLLLRHVKNELRRLLHPSAVLHVRTAGQVVERDVIGSVTAFFILYIGLFAVAALFMSALGVDVLTSIASVAATIGNIGPGLGTVGPAENYAHIPLAGKWVLSFCMLLGRLEIYTVMILFLPETWRR
ncbi:potassium uptake protein, TrkH family [Thermovirga lienii DSM 17291]|uniref:Potassium uptake protein, TrkH family n=1 Tax=Thermovirga lienii (strain ATCC BAA-1197 / DSM 17291 / Cas60314) TaxID=580340 RepID=G7V6W6_THELD|nr:TrkH family potassium uptake protein [Thermovirga lienii]AER67155.1 potassium uptake protein, TrkH family [Thermovirga lienii DSM 17291]